MHVSPKNRAENLERIEKGWDRYPLAISYLSFCDPIIFLSILGFRLWLNHKTFAVLRFLNAIPYNMQDEEERPRPDFAAKAPYLEKNPITGIKEPSFPRSIRHQPPQTQITSLISTTSTTNYLFSNIIYITYYIL